MSARCSRPLSVSCALVTLMMMCGPMVMASEPGSTDKLLFQRDVLPIFQRKCTKCHSEGARKANLDLTSFAAFTRGGESGPMLSEEPSEGLLFEMVHQRLMPPDDEPPLSADELDIVVRWLQQGAPSAKPHESTEHSLTDRDVLPILMRRCSNCHGATYQEGRLDIRSLDSILKGGESGAAIVPGDSEASLLIKRIAAREMPPQDSLGRAGIERVESEELQKLRDWIDAGAVGSTIPIDVASAAGDPLVTVTDRQFWSFIPPGKTTPPPIANPERARNQIDVFLLAKLDQHGLSFSAEADRYTLLRRAKFDLLGLPPTPAEINGFVNDRRPDAYGRLIDRLLSSPAYGERWGRYWLDLAGYADSEGKRNADMIRKFAWRYRDYVIRAFNADRPYDQFLRQQLAGDELAPYATPEQRTPEVLENLIATGFLRMAPDGTTANPVNRIEDRMEVISDEIDIFGRGVMGLTLRCAQCHSHKYDPIPQRDYYRLTAIFRGAYDPYDWMVPQGFTNQWEKAKQRYLPYAPPDEVAAWKEAKKKHAAELKKFEDELSVEKESARDRIIATRLADLSDGELERLIAARRTDKQVRTVEQVKLLQQHREAIDVSDSVLAKQDKAYKAKSAAINKQIRSLNGKQPTQPMIRALWDRGEPSDTYVLRRGDHLNPAQLVGPGVLSALTDGKTEFEVPRPFEDSPGSGRRLALAKWLAQPDHPLTARVMVNRIWHHHFGRGIVASLDNFGSLGARPTHPELLDWLAVTFVESDWSVKEIHRRIMMSAAYRQSSTPSAAALAHDPDNQLLSRMPIRRLDAEAVRDALLLISDRLVHQPFGPPDDVDVRQDGLVMTKAKGNAWRRTIYVRQRRKELPTILETFDLPQMNPNCTSRPSSTIVSQPLFLLNNRRVFELSQNFAARLCEEFGDDSPALVHSAVLWTTGREANDDEMTELTKALADLGAERASGDESNGKAKQQALADLCHVLFNAAEFLYLD